MSISSSTTHIATPQPLVSYPNFEQELFDYENLLETSYITCTQPISTAIGLKLIYAMELNKVIFLPAPPIFTDGCFPFVKEIILGRLNKVVIANIEVLDPIDKSSFLASALNSKINYLLTRHQKSILRSYIRLHFRQLAPGA
jgi:hypothetical protein